MADQVELKLCPFCKAQLEYFGKDRWEGKIQDCYRHPINDENLCALSGLIFTDRKWQSRPLEDALQAEVEELTQENKKLRELIEAIKSQPVASKSVIRRLESQTGAQEALKNE